MTGRPSKGDRVVVYFRPHRSVRQAIEANAKRRGYTHLSDYISAVMAAHEGLGEHAPAPDLSPSSDEELPLTA